MSRASQGSSDIIQVCSALPREVVRSFICIKRFPAKEGDDSDVSRDSQGSIEIVPPGVAMARQGVRT